MRGLSAGKVTPTFHFQLLLRVQAAPRQQMAKKTGVPSFLQPALALQVEAFLHHSLALQAEQISSRLAPSRLEVTRASNNLVSCKV